VRDQRRSAHSAKVCFIECAAWSALAKRRFQGFDRAESNNHINDGGLWASSARRTTEPGAPLEPLEERSKLRKVSLNPLLILITGSSKHGVYLDWGPRSGAPFAGKAFKGARG
jgi:hypothetical protein